MENVPIMAENPFAHAFLKSKLPLMKGKMHLSEAPLEPCSISQMDPHHISNVYLFEENSGADVKKKSMLIEVLFTIFKYLRQCFAQ